MRSYHPKTSGILHIYAGTSAGLSEKTLVSKLRVRKGFVADPINATDLYMRAIIELSLKKGTTKGEFQDPGSHRAFTWEIRMDGKPS